jgi:hypothetical protein
MTILSEAGPRITVFGAIHAEATFPSFFASRQATPSAARQARWRRDQITTKTIGKQSSHQLGGEANRVNAHACSCGKPISYR